MILGGFLFVLGLIVGSFINSFLWRYQEKKTFKGRSMCPACKHKIAWYDNIPIISWFLLSGKCRHCKKSISVQYPAVELLTAICFSIIGTFSVSAIQFDKWLNGISSFKFQISNEALILNLITLILLLLATSCMILIAVYDYKTKEIPNGFNLTFVILCGLFLLVSNYPQYTIPNTLYPILSGLFAFLFFYSLVYFSKETWMGGGDAKFAFGMGLMLGPAGTFLAILLASVIGSIYGLSLIAISRLSSRASSPSLRAKRGNLVSSKGFLHSQRSVEMTSLSSEIPFGPFLALGTYVSMVFGPQIIDFYVKMVLGI